MRKTKNNEAWRRIFEKHDIVDSVAKTGFFEISSNQINDFREARLMTKFDHRSQLPDLFVENGLSILPISRGGYIIGAFETFYSFEADEPDVSSIEFPVFLESLDHKDITSESTAINCAFVSNILHDFTGEETLLPTVSGRMGSSSFSFDINSPKGRFRVGVENSQIEIDAGYEGDRSLIGLTQKLFELTDFAVPDTDSRIVVIS